MVGRIIVIYHLIAYLIGRYSYRFGRYECKVDDLIGRAVVREGCGIIKLLIRDLIGVLHSCRNNSRECSRIIGTVEVTGKYDGVITDSLEILDENFSLQLTCFRARMIKVCIDDHYLLAVGLPLEERVGVDSGK